LDGETKVLDGAVFPYYYGWFFRLKDIVSSTSGYHLCLNCNLT